jgi:histidinol-phosphate aminotransferase
MNLTFVPGTANFVMVQVGDGHAVFQRMLKRKVIIRPLKGYNLPDWVRISVGTKEQNKRCIEALKECLST